MELYILDEQNRPFELVDRFESLIWTERFNTFGDFELITPLTQANKARFQTESYLGCNKSDRIMRVETVRETKDAENKNVLKISGRSLESILDQKPSYRQAGGTNITDPVTEYSARPPLEQVRSIITAVLLPGQLAGPEVLPWIFDDSQYPEDNIVPTSEAIVVRAPYQDTLWQTIQPLLEAYDLGVRVYRMWGETDIWLDVYAGVDRTDPQKIPQPIVFSAQTDSLFDIERLTSIETYKNVCNVRSRRGAVTVYGDGAGADLPSSERKVMTVWSDLDITDATQRNLELTKIGIEELGKNRPTLTMDGEIAPHAEFRYRQDYNLGDKIELRDSDGAAARMRVTEFIFSDGMDGETEYPTLTQDEFVNPGSWMSWNWNIPWNSAEGVWDDAS